MFIMLSVWPFIINIKIIKSKKIYGVWAWSAEKNPKY